MTKKGSMKDRVWYDTQESEPGLEREDMEYMLEWLSQVPLEGKVIAIADLGLWNGRHIGVRVGNATLREVLHMGQSIERLVVRVSNRNIVVDQYHHDGVHHIKYRMITNPRAEERMVRELSQGIQNDEYINRNTKSLISYMNKLKEY